MSEELRQKIIKGVREWIKNPKFTITEHINPKSGEFIFNITGKLDENENLYKVENRFHYFITLPPDKDYFFVSAYFHFDESDNIGFKVSSLQDKILFANEMKIPILTLGLAYEWIPSLEKIEAIVMLKYIWFDGFSKHNFNDSVIRVLNAHEIITAKYAEFRNKIYDKLNKK